VTGLILPQPKVNDVRRLAALLGILSLLFGLAACGDDAGANADDGTGGLDAVTVTGDVGKAPEVKWNSTVDVDKTETKTLVEGDGDKLAKGDTALVHIWIGNGFSKEKAYSTYDKGEAQTLTVDDAQILKGLYDGVVDHTVGSRVLVVSPPADAFKDTGNPDLGIADSDNVVFIIDIINKIVTLDGPEGTPQKVPADAPQLQEKDGTPTGFDFSKAPKEAPDKLQVYTVIKGNGEKVESGDNTTMNYLGMVYGSDKIFDQSYGREPFSTTIGAGQVIKGWDEGLVGVTVGSRVILVIPPDLAYGEQGSGDTIPPNSTLVFVVDVLAAY